MASFVTPANGELATSEHVAQLTEDFGGLRNIPVSLTGINDASAYALTLKNGGTGGKGLIVYAADGVTVLLQVDGAGSILANPHLAGPRVDSGDLVLATSDIQTRRLIANQGTPLVNGDFALSAGWGSTATVSAGANSTDQRGRFTVAPSGAGIASSPTVTLTYKNGAWPVAPIVLCQLVGGTGAGINIPMAFVYGTTTVNIQTFFTPVSGTTYIFAFQTMG